MSATARLQGKTVMEGSSERHCHVSDEEFVRVWNESDSAKDVAIKLGYKLDVKTPAGHAVSQRASRLRKRGVKMKWMSTRKSPWSIVR